jgi:regulation of enolase protein 1 (concanavalin A-like superfamily)
MFLRPRILALLLGAVLSLIFAPLTLGQTINPPFTDTFESLKGWASEDLGDALGSVGGTETSVAGGELIVVGTGNTLDIGVGGVRFVYQKISGDFVAQVKVTVLPTYQPQSAAGLMVRQDLSDDSPMAFVFVTRDQGTFFVARTSAEEFSKDTGSKATFKPIWLRLVRRGEFVQGFYSLNGETWSNLVGAPGVPSFARLPIKDPVLLGVAVNAANNTAVDIAHFDDFVVTRPAEGTAGFLVTVTAKGEEEPPDGVYVRAVDSQGKELGGAYVTGGKALVLSGLPEGTVKLQAVGDGFETAETTLTLSANKIAEARLEVVRTSTPSPTGKLTGTVLDNAGKPQANVSILVISEGASALGPLYKTAKTDGKGVYSLDLPPGTYSVIRTSDLRYVPVGDDVKKGVAIAAGQTATVNFTVQPLPVIALSTENGYNWKIKIPVDPSEDHKALDDPETDFIEYVVSEGKSPWGVIDPTSRIYAWVRLKFKLPESIKAFRGNDLRLYDFTFEDVETTYWNGVKIGGAGYHSPDVMDDTGFVSAWNTVRNYTVPASAVNWDGDNVIAIFGFVRNSSAENGGFSVKSPPLLTVVQTAEPKIVKGDLNGDGLVSVADATLALRFAVGLGTPTPAQLKAGALTDGKRISVADATRILRAAVGLGKLE